MFTFWSTSVSICGPVSLRLISNHGMKPCSDWRCFRPQQRGCWRAQGTHVDRWPQFCVSMSHLWALRKVPFPNNFPKWTIIVSEILFFFFFLLKLCLYLKVTQNIPSEEFVFTYRWALIWGISPSLIFFSHHK